MHAKALLLIEVTSPETRRNDLEVKPDLYHRCKVPLYAIVDRQGGERGDEVRLIGYRATRTRFAPLPLDERGWLWLEPVRLWLAVEQDRVICYDENGRRIPPPNERARAAEALAREAEREKSDLQKRVEQLEAQLRRARRRP